MSVSSRIFRILASIILAMMLVAGARSANCRSQAGLQDQLSPIIVSMIPRQAAMDATTCSMSYA
jgi:hypothetical protein